MGRSFWLYKGKNHILDGDHELELANMGNSGAIWFIDLTHALTKHYGMPPCISEEMDCWGDHQVEGENFCQLVEHVFNNQGDELYDLPEVKSHYGLNGWARIAAGMFQIIRDRLYDWTWEMKEEPSYHIHENSWARQPFFPIRYATDSWPTVHSGETIGKKK